MTASTAKSLLSNTVDITTAEFNTLREIIYDTFGVALSDEKRSLILGRLRPVLSREGIDSFADYIKQVRSDPSRKLLSELVNRISTNHTFFNRESSHFDFYVKTALPEAVQRNKRGSSGKLRVWCAAASMGQEPYTLAALLMRHLGASYDAWDAGVLATDINTEVLSFAQEGIYDAADAESLPEPLLRQFFTQLPDGRYRARDRLRREVIYRRFNLMNRSLPFKEKFDIIFIRNVMIYFDEDTKRDLVKRLGNHMVPGGYMFIGTAESIPSDPRQLKPVAPGVFKKA